MNLVDQDTLYGSLSELLKRAKKAEEKAHAEFSRACASDGISDRAYKDALIELAGAKAYAQGIEHAIRRVEELQKTKA